MLHPIACMCRRKSFLTLHELQRIYLHPIHTRGIHASRWREQIPMVARTEPASGLVKPLTDATMSFRSNCSRFEGTYVILHQSDATLSRKSIGPTQQPGVKRPSPTHFARLEGTRHGACNAGSRRQKTSQGCDESGYGRLTRTGSGSPFQSGRILTCESEDGACGPRQPLLPRHHPRAVIDPHMCAVRTEQASLRVDHGSQAKLQRQTVRTLFFSRCRNIAARIQHHQPRQRIGNTLRHWNQPNRKCRIVTSIATTACQDMVQPAVPAAMHCDES